MLRIHLLGLLFGVATILALEIEDHDSGSARKVLQNWSRYKSPGSGSSPWGRGDSPRWWLRSPRPSPSPSQYNPSQPSPPKYSPQGNMPPPSPPMGTNPPPSRYPPASPPMPTTPPPSGGGGGGAPSDYQSVLKQHNDYRTKHHAPPLTWSAQVASQAQKWANNCKFQHSQGTGYGENLGMGYKSFEDCVKAWYDEHSQYNYGSGGFSGATGHFTQVVWAGTKELGCAVAQCNGRPLYVCNYNPPGNYQGKYQENVKAP